MRTVEASKIKEKGTKGPGLAEHNLGEIVSNIRTQVQSFIDTQTEIKTEQREGKKWSALSLIRTRSYLSSMAIMAAIVAFFIVGSRLGIDRPALATISILVGLLTKAFAGVIGLIAFIPVVGPTIVTIITMPFFLTVNAIAYLVTFLAIRKGYTQNVIDSRILVVTLLTGIVIGFLIGRLI